MSFIAKSLQSNCGGMLPVDLIAVIGNGNIKQISQINTFFTANYNSCHWTMKTNNQPHHTLTTSINSLPLNSPMIDHKDHIEEQN